MRETGVGFPVWCRLSVEGFLFFAVRRVGALKYWFVCLCMFFLSHCFVLFFITAEYLEDFEEE